MPVKLVIYQIIIYAKKVVIKMYTLYMNKHVFKAVNNLKMEILTSEIMVVILWNV